MSQFEKKSIKTHNLQQNYQQTEKFREQNKQDEALIQYYVYKDLQNLINLIYSRKAILEHYQNDLNHPMITLSNNKIILQLNLSCGIHYDLFYQYQKEPKLKMILEQERKCALNILKKILGENKQLMSFDGQQCQGKQQQELEGYLWKYISNQENTKFNLNEFQLQETDIATQFDQQVIEKIIQSIQTVDGEANQIGNTHSYQKPNIKEIISKAQVYQNMTSQKLKENFNKTSSKCEVKNNEFNTSKNFNGALINFADNSKISEEDQLIEFLELLGCFEQITNSSLFYKETINLIEKIKEKLKKVQWR